MRARSTVAALVHAAATEQSAIGMNNSFGASATAGAWVRKRPPQHPTESLTRWEPHAGEFACHHIWQEFLTWEDCAGAFAGSGIEVIQAVQSRRSLFCHRRACKHLLAVNERVSSRFVRGWCSVQASFFFQEVQRCDSVFMAPL